METSPPPVLDYLNPQTGEGIRSAFWRFPPLDRLVLRASALLLPCAAFLGDNDYDECWIVTVLAISLVVTLLVRWAIVLLTGWRPRDASAPRRWRMSALIVLALWMLLVQGTSCPHADILRVGPWYCYWGRPCYNAKTFQPVVVWLLSDEHRHMTWTPPTVRY